MRLLLAAALLLPAPLLSQTPTYTPATPLRADAAANPLSTLDFLLGSWAAQTDAPAGSAGASVVGTYSFRRDLNGHALQRTGSLDTCKGPQTFDCSHHDQLTIFTDANGLTSVHKATLFALYLDSEGHVIYYTVSMPDAHTAVFASQGPAAGPKFRLTYHLEGEGAKAVMTGRFEGAAPGSDDYHPYLVWSGTKL